MPRWLARNLLPPPPPTPPRGGVGVSPWDTPLYSRSAHLVKLFFQKKSQFFRRFFLTFSRLSSVNVHAPSRSTRKKSEKKCTKDVDDWRSRLYAIRMKIENEIKWSDLENIETEGRTMADVCLTSAYHKVWDRELTDDELDLVASEFQHEIYMMMLDRR